VPHLAPNYSFGMAPFVPAPTPTPFNSAALVDEIRSEYHDPDPRATPVLPPTSPDALPEIAAVYAHNRDYTIVLVGTDTIDGHACYHLALTPTREPNRFRIRAAWIDQQTFAPWQLENALNFTTGPGTYVGWMIHFADVDGAHYIREEDALTPMAVGGEIYTKTAIRFESEHSVANATLRELADAGRPLEEPRTP
jgi:Outer membrane lipoprotein-sorting protein